MTVPVESISVTRRPSAAPAASASESALVRGVHSMLTSWASRSSSWRVSAASLDWRRLPAIATMPATSAMTRTSDPRSSRFVSVTRYAIDRFSGGSRIREPSR